MKSKITLVKFASLLLVFALAFWSCKKKKNAWDGLNVGDEFQGGYIGYFSQYGDPGWDKGTFHGFVVSKTDLNDTMIWSNNYARTGSTSWSLSSGKLNTYGVVANQGNGNYAAKACADLDINGFSDWYLPSRDELYQLRYYATPSMNLKPGYYWSSMEDEDSTMAWAQDRESGYQKAIDKKTFARVRAIRTF